MNMQMKNVKMIVATIFVGVDVRGKGTKSGTNETI